MSESESKIKLTPEQVVAISAYKDQYGQDLRPYVEWAPYSHNSALEPLNSLSINGVADALRDGWEVIESINSVTEGEFGPDYIDQRSKGPVFHEFPSADEDVGGGIGDYISINMDKVLFFRPCPVNREHTEIYSERWDTTVAFSYEVVKYMLTETKP